MLQFLYLLRASVVLPPVFFNQRVQLLVLFFSVRKRWLVIMTLYSIMFQCLCLRAWSRYYSIHSWWWWTKSIPLSFVLLKQLINLNRGLLSSKYFLCTLILLHWITNSALCRLMLSNCCLLALIILLFEVVVFLLEFLSHFWVLVHLLYELSYFLVQILIPVH